MKLLAIIKWEFIFLYFYVNQESVNILKVSKKNINTS